VITWDEAVGKHKFLAEVWDIASSMPRAGLRPIGSKGKSALALSKDGKWLAFADGNKIYINSLRSDDSPIELEQRGAVSGLDFSPDSTLLASCGADKTARVWSIETRQPIGEPIICDDPVETIRFAETNENLITVDKTGRVQRWNIKPKVLQPFYSTNEQQFAAFPTTRSDGLVAVSSDGTVEQYTLPKSGISKASKASLGFPLVDIGSLGIGALSPVKGKIQTTIQSIGSLYFSWIPEGSLPWAHHSSLEKR